MKNNHYKYKPLKQNQINFNINTSLLTHIINYILTDGFLPIDDLENYIYSLIVYIKYYKLTHDLDSINDIKSMLLKKEAFNVDILHFQRKFDYYVNKI